MPCCTPAGVAGHRLKTVPSSPRSSKRGHNARFSRRFQYGVTGRILARGYLGKLIDNKAVYRFLKQRQIDVLAEFESIIQTVVLDGK